MHHPGRHPFLQAPHRTMVRLSLPVLLSLVAEPLTGLADTAFIARLGAGPLAALGVGTIALSGVFWIFNFLGIGAQTEIARSLGAGRSERAREVAGLAVVLAALFGIFLLLAGFPAARTAAGLMGAAAKCRMRPPPTCAGAWPAPRRSSSSPPPSAPCADCRTCAPRSGSPPG